MLKQATVLGERLRSASHVKIVSHIDADGLTAAAVAVRALERAGISYETEFLKSLTPEHAERLKNENPETLWFTDLGSGAADLLLAEKPVISDHHVPTARGDYHLNCHFYEEDGSRYLSGATTTYLVARAMDRANRDMSQVAIVGAVGDLQDSDAGHLTGMNRVVLEDAAASGFLARSIDARYFGRETRPLPKLLQFADDPLIPQVSGRHDACCAFLDQLDVHYRANDAWRHWTHLSDDEKRRILSAIAKSLLAKGFGHQAVRRLVGEVYVLPHEEAGTPVRDAKEFATLLNSTARYGEADVGLAVALGDREDAYAKALQLLRGHRQNLVHGIQLVRDQGLTEREHLQWFHAGDGIRETIVGIVTGMMFNGNGIRRDLPIIAFAAAEEGKVKVSARANRGLIQAGVNLAACMREAAAAVGGAGGGHAPAAGATIPKGREEEFLTACEVVLARQMLK